MTKLETLLNINDAYVCSVTTTTLGYRFRRQKSMKHQNIERNKLDYIISDLLPVEIPELFSLNGFYKYLIENQNTLDKIVSSIKSKRAKNDEILFENGWATAPLKFNILKGFDGQRELSLIQPFSMINIYLFLECYQKELLILLRENAIFSLRYHRKNNDLYYKKRIKQISEYYQSTAKKVDKGILQQTGAFYKIYPFNSVSSFTSSKKWQQLNFKYSNFARMDYKSCFDSIYTHVYKWITQKNVVDSKDAKNGSLYVTIDRILQNINSKSSNGVVVGPEFSRMIVELLLQEIDVEVMTRLSKKGFVKGKDYDIYRYVDDIFIFACSSELVEEIIMTITSVAQKYLIRPNELKLLKTTTPFILSNWLSRTRELSEKIAGLFYSNKEMNDFDENEKYLLKETYSSVEKIKNDFNSIICEFPNEKRTIVSFCLSTLLNNISKKKNGIKLLKPQSENRAFHILELAMYIYAFCTCFEHTQRIISMIVYFDDELKFQDNSYNHKKLQALFSKYMFILIRGNLNDLSNLFLLFYEYKIIIPSNYEEKIYKRIEEMNNPLLYAIYLLYSKYYEAYYNEILHSIEKIIDNKVNHITDGEEMLQEEFWYIIIFNNCPFLSSELKMKMQQIVDRIRFPNPSYPNQIITNLICDYLSSGQNNLFFSWGVHRFSTSKQIAFRTYQRSLFREFKNKNSELYFGSLD